jgi:PAS domain S-box-containing protein
VIARRGPATGVVTACPVYFNKRYQDHLRSVIADFDALEEPSIEKLIGELIHPEDAVGVGRTLRNCFETGAAAVMRFRWREKGGAYRWAECRGEPRRDQDGAVAEWYGVSLDIDDEVRATQALRDRERELSVLVDMVPSHLWRLTPDGETTLVNKRLADFLGVEVSDKRRLVEALATIFHPDDAEAVGDVLGRCLVTGEQFSMRYRLRRADGAYRWMSGRAEPMRDEGGRIVEWFGLCHDIDDQIHAEDALRRGSDKLAQATRAASLAELSASIAHEVNQPLAAIVANSHACQRWLSAEPPNVERAMLTAERITRDANSAATARVRSRSAHRVMASARFASRFATPEPASRMPSASSSRSSRPSSTGWVWAWPFAVRSSNRTGVASGWPMAILAVRSSPSRFRRRQAGRMKRRANSPPADAPMDDHREPPGAGSDGDAHRGEARIVQRDRRDEGNDMRCRVSRKTEHEHDQ